MAPILTREDGRIDFTRTAQSIYDRWRGFQPWPGAHTTLRGKKLIVHRDACGNSSSQRRAGTLIVQGDTMMVPCANGTADWAETRCRPKASGA